MFTDLSECKEKKNLKYLEVVQKQTKIITTKMLFIKYYSKLQTPTDHLINHGFISRVILDVFPTCNTIGFLPQSNNLLPLYFQSIEFMQSTRTHIKSFCYSELKSKSKIELFQIRRVSMMKSELKDVKDVILKSLISRLDFLPFSFFSRDPKKLVIEIW